MPRIAISGSTGFIGSSLVASLRARGHEVLRLVRRSPDDPRDLADDKIAYDIDAGAIDTDGLAGVDAVVHLAGESVGDGRWTAKKKERILESRKRGTHLIASAVAALDHPCALISASAIGIYGERGDEELDETSAHGEGFLADVCEAWESAANPAREAGKRTVTARIGVVLAEHGGALAKMLPPFKLGLGGVMGSGDQWMSWISLDDVVAALVHLVESETASGVFNLVAPQPVTNRELTDALGRHLHRPTIFPMPAFAARLAFGERADALLLCSAHVAPNRLLEDGYVFHHRDIDAALASILASDVSPRGEQSMEAA